MQRINRPATRIHSAQIIRTFTSVPVVGSVVVFAGALGVFPVDGALGADGVFGDVGVIEAGGVLGAGDTGAGVHCAHKETLPTGIVNVAAEAYATPDPSA